MRKIDSYIKFISEAKSIEIDDYIIHDDDIESIFEPLYSDVSQLKNSEISLKEVTDSDHPHIRQSIGLKKSVSQFRVRIFIDSKYTKDTDWFNRFYQPYANPSKKILSEDILKEIGDRMYNQFGYKLEKSATLSYDNGVSLPGGKQDPNYKNGYCLDFYFIK